MPSILCLNSFLSQQVEVVGDAKFSEDDFTWTSGLVDSPVDFSDDRISVHNGGKTLKASVLYNFIRL